MTARWRYLDGAGDQTGSSDAFPSRDAAESWLAGVWEDLAADGVVEVVLEVDDREAYRMGLSREGGSQP